MGRGLYQQEIIIITKYKITMGALKIDIQDFKPCLTDESIDKIVKAIITKLDIYNYEGYKLLEFECANGINIDVEVNYRGFDYRNIQLNHIYVMYKVDEDYKSIEEYEEILNSLLSDAIGELNYKEEEEYEYEKQYS